MVQPGERLGNYEVATSADGSAAVLGSGAGGVTYRGRHIHLGTEVAIKLLLRRRHILQKDRDAFLSEARAAASLAHPRIARILDFGESAQQHPYYVMEICEGGSLEDLVRRSGNPSQETCLQWLFESAAALAHAHQKGILHRDIKPSNLLLSFENQTATIKLIDFGLADQTGDAGADAVIGTPLFAAPEQLRGQAEAASDVFSLGASFLWLLTGNFLSQGDVKAVISERLAATDYAGALASLPEAWRALLGRMLEIDPAKRLCDGGEVLAALRENFPDHIERPVSWDTTAEPRAASPAALPSQWLDRPETDGAALWKPVGQAFPTAHGTSFRATPAEGGEVCDVSLFTMLAEDVAEALTAQGDAVARHAAPLGIDPVLLERGAGWWCVAWPALDGPDALSWVRQGHGAGPGELLAALEPVAIGLDALASNGFEHLEIHPSMLIVRQDAENAPLRFSLALDLPVLASSDAAADSAGTLRGAAGANLPARFAACAYQLLSGRAVPPAAFVNARAYQAIPKLTERSNRFLSSAIAGTLSDAVCRDVISGLLHEERITGASHSGSASIAGLTRSASSLRSGASISSPVPAAPTPPAPAVSPVVAPAPPLPPPSPPPVVVASGRSHLGSWLMVIGIVAVFLGVIGTGVWWGLGKLKGPEKKPDKPPQTTKVERPTEPPSKAPEPTPPKETSPPDASLLKVPGDAATVAEAVARCKDGGTIEIAGGTFSDALVLNKSLTITSPSAAVFEDRGGGSNFITVRGPVKVTLRNIQIRNSQQQAAAALEKSPALVLAADGATVRFDGCVIESSVGNGVSLVDRASSVFSNCRVRRNRGYGINITSGSKAEVSLSEIQQSGRSGIAIANVGSVVTLGSGAAVSDNSKNGVEVSNGAALHATGATFNGNQLVGIIVEGSGSLAELGSSCLVSGNRKYGVGIRNAGRVSLTDCTIEENRENGLYVESGAQVAISSCQFKRNGTIGAYLVNGAETSVSVTKSEFESHSDSGVAFVEGTGKVTDCQFSRNKMAVYFGKDSKGEVVGNTVRPGPIEDAVVIEGTDGVRQADNVVGAPR